LIRVLSPFTLLQAASLFDTTSRRMTDAWRIFRGDKSRHPETPLPPPPPWRDFSRTDDHRAATFQASDAEVRMVNASLYLRRPLLVTGPPGSGKSSLAYAVAEELQLGDVIRWSINSRSTLADGLYRYDAVARLRQASLDRARGGDAGEPEEESIGRYLTLGPLGTALLPRGRPRVLLIDEIDKSDIDLPNDLLHVFEEGRYEIPELVRLASERREVAILPVDGRSDADRVAIAAGRVAAREFPFVVITSNGERDLPPAFLRRCLRLDVPQPDAERIRSIVAAHLGDVKGTAVDELVDGFLRRREEGRLIAIDQLLSAVRLVTAEPFPGDDDWEFVREALLRELNPE